MVTEKGLNEVKRKNILIKVAVVAIATLAAGYGFGLTDEQQTRLIEIGMELVE